MNAHADTYEPQNPDARGFVLDAAGRLVFDPNHGPDTVEQYVADYLDVPADERDRTIEIGFEYEDGTYPVLRWDLADLTYDNVGTWDPARGRVTFHTPY